MTFKNSNTISIGKEEYNRLLKYRAKLLALESGGVDNWGGYSESLKEYNKKYNPEWYEDEEKC